MSNVGEQTDC